MKGLKGSKNLFWRLVPRRRELLAERNGAVVITENYCPRLVVHARLEFDRTNWPLAKEIFLTNASVRLLHFFRQNPRIYDIDWRVISGPAYFCTLDLDQLDLSPFQYCQFQSAVFVLRQQAVNYEHLAQSIVSQLIPWDYFRSDSQGLDFLSCLISLCPDPRLSDLQAVLTSS